MLRLIKRHFWPWFWDAIVWGLAGWLGGACLYEYRPGEKLAELLLIIPLVLILPVNALWLPLRIGPRLVCLAERPRREELALTFIRPREYLAAHLFWPVLRGLLPSAIALPLFLGLLLYNAGRDDSVLLMTLIIGALGLTCLATPLNYCSWCFRRLLEGRMRPNTYYLLAPGLTLLTLIALGTVYYLFVLLFEAVHVIEEFGFAVFFLVTLAYVSALIALALLRIPKIIRLYFHFE